MREVIEYEKLTRMTDVVPVYDVQGKKQQEIKLPEKIMPLFSKRGGFADSGLYYKGAGTIYQGHFVNEGDKGLRLIQKTNVIYEKYQVCYPMLVGKYGIFTFPHQTIFTDLEGGCGNKEKNLIEMQKKFELSAIREITDVIPTGIQNHNIYVYCLKSDKTELYDVIKLIEYVLSEDFNTAWDKNLWKDISCYQYVRDVGDWFVSNKLCHKLGTIYALLHSLYKEDIYQYAMLLKSVLDVYNSERNYILYYSALIVNKYLPSLFYEIDLDVKEISSELYAELLKLLFAGKACCHLEDDEKWIWVREYFISRIDKYVKTFERRLVRSLYFV